MKKPDPNSAQNSANISLLGVDTGGTFTDFVLFSSQGLQIHKVLSTPKAPEQAILQGIHELGLDEQLGELIIIHGSTVATNAVLEGKGVKTAYVTNLGLADVLSIGRQARSELYNLMPKPKPVPVAKELCLEVDCRLDVNGKRLSALNESKLKTLCDELNRLAPEAIAINLLYSFLAAGDEQTIESYLKHNLKNKKTFIARSSKVLAEYKEFERGMATWLNAWVGPKVEGYIQRLQQGVKGSPLTVMQSSGGTMAADYASDNAVRMLLSGPAGGLAGAKFIANQAGIKRLLTFDMGGTSTDVAVIEEQLKLTNQGKIGDYPVAIPMVDMHTIGAGGGSIAYCDQGGMLQVGPQSAGALPGPACYGLGGENPTVTDANLVLGRLSANNKLAGSMRLDLDAATQAIEKLAKQIGLSLLDTADGIIQIANEHMSRALRVMSVQRGIAPSSLVLVPFGGAGGLHVCALAESLDMDNAMVPIHAGVLSALGMIVAPASREMSKTHNQILDNHANLQALAESICSDLQSLAQSGREQLLNDGVQPERIQFFYSLDLRYQGQSYTLNLPWSSIQGASTQDISNLIDSFHQAHEKRYGHRHQQAIELVNLRVKVEAQNQPLSLPSLAAAEDNSAPEPIAYRRVHGKVIESHHGFSRELPVYERASLLAGQVISGPALISEKVSTTFIHGHWSCEVDNYGNLLLKRMKNA